MYKIKVKIDTKDMMDNVKKELEMCMNDFILDIKNDATTKAYEDEPQHSQRSGQLGDTMVASSEWQGSKLVGKVQCQVEYAEFVEHGSGEFSDEHRGSRTGWYTKHVSSKGKEYTVYHHGQKGKHFMLRTCKEYRPKVKQYFRIGG